MDDTHVFCGACGKHHYATNPPEWDYTDDDVIRAVCGECEETLIEIEREP
jgi:hypothetical protein